MDSFITVEDGRYIIRNRTDPLENFADKWEQFPERRTAFFGWLNQARSDFRAYCHRHGPTPDRREHCACNRPKTLAERAQERIAGRKQALLRVGLCRPNNCTRVSEPPSAFQLSLRDSRDLVGFSTWKGAGGRAAIARP